MARTYVLGRRGYKISWMHPIFEAKLWDESEGHMLVEWGEEGSKKSRGHRSCELNRAT